MKFFNKQKVDQVGITAVSLQKILLFLMILSVFTLFNGGFFSFLLCLIGFLGAYRRSTGMLTAYFSISLILIVICSVVAISSVFLVSTDNYEYYSSGSSSESFVTNNAASVYKLKQVFARGVRSAYPTPTGGPSESPSESASESGSESSSETTIPAYSESSSSFENDDDATGLIFLFIVVLVLAFFLAYCKIYSLVLTWRLRKMILAAATSLPTEAPQTHEFAPANTSCAVPEPTDEMPQAPLLPPHHPSMFAPPAGYAPYPYAMPYMMNPQQQMQMQMQMQMQGGQPQFPGQFPPHMMMYGQQPVFYTYAPPQPSTEEKL